MNILIISMTFADFNDVITYIGGRGIRYIGKWYTRTEVDDETLVYLKCRYKVIPHEFAKQSAYIIE